MPSKPLRPCRHPGCCEFVPSGYCSAHQPKLSGDRSEEAKGWRWMYSTAVWTQDLRPTQLLRQPWCEECAKLGLRVRAMDVDHRRDHKGDWSIFTDRSNLRSLCHSCHSRKTARDLWKNRAKKAAQNSALRR